MANLEKKFVKPSNVKKRVSLAFLTAVTSKNGKFLKNHNPNISPPSVLAKTCISVFNAHNLGFLSPMAHGRVQNKILHYARHTLLETSVFPLKSAKIAPCQFWEVLAIFLEASFLLLFSNTYVSILYNNGFNNKHLVLFLPSLGQN